MSSNRVLVDGAGWWRKQKTVATVAWVPSGGLGGPTHWGSCDTENGTGARGKVKVRADSDTRISDLERAD